MSNEIAITYIYLIIGLIVMSYDWYKYQKPVYDIAKKYGETEDGMAIIYMTAITLFWPIKLLSYLKK